MFFCNDTATTEIYTLSLHDALPIWPALPPPRPARAGGQLALLAGTRHRPGVGAHAGVQHVSPHRHPARVRDRKSTRLNSSHANISYAVFCLIKNHTNVL